jgi:chromosome segregation ATPase
VLQLHVLFAIPKYWDDSLRESHATFYCPAGHGQSYTGPTEADKLRAKLKETEKYRANAAHRTEMAEAEAVHLRDQLGATERSLRGHKAAKTRIKNRIAAGVCPCCNRQFQNLHRHMTGQHPNFPTQDPEVSV